MITLSLLGAEEADSHEPKHFFFSFQTLPEHFQTYIDSHPGARNLVSTLKMEMCSKLNWEQHPKYQKSSRLPELIAGNNMIEEDPDHKPLQSELD